MNLIYNLANETIWRNLSYHNEKQDTSMFHVVLQSKLREKFSSTQTCCNPKKGKLNHPQRLESRSSKFCLLSNIDLLLFLWCYLEHQGCTCSQMPLNASNLPQQNYVLLLSNRGYYPGHQHKYKNTSQHIFYKQSWNFETGRKCIKHLQGFNNT